MTKKGREGTFWSDDNVICLDRDYITHTQAFEKTHQRIESRSEHFTSCKF